MWQQLRATAQVQKPAWDKPEPIGAPACRQQARNRPVVGEDRTYSLQVDFLDAVFGTSTEIEVRFRDLVRRWAVAS